MKRYDYRQAVKESVYDYIKENKLDLCQSSQANQRNTKTLEEYEKFLYELVINDDFVTGNMSGSYTCDTYKALEYLSMNNFLFVEAFDYFDITTVEDIRSYLETPETLDVLIRMMYVREVVCEIVKEINER